MATHASIPAWRILKDRGVWWAIVRSCKESNTSKQLSISSVQFSCSVMSNSSRPHELQHARPLCPSPTPRVYSNSCPLSRWCHSAISPFVVPFSSCPQSLPASGSFLMSQLFAWGGHSTSTSLLQLSILQPSVYYFDCSTASVFWEVALSREISSFLAPFSVFHFLWLIFLGSSFLLWRECARMTHLIAFWGTTKKNHD